MNTSAGNNTYWNKPLRRFVTSFQQLLSLFIFVLTTSLILKTVIIFKNDKTRFSFYMKM
ncbi:uncharacterized protein METZ01_LOCUS206831 [marine metagenome]|uniref:Uncharacterized protein n=1 Tax=marine metagenome TaxID=408172 RepID=A0A382EVW7_9ZZZZ